MKTATDGRFLYFFPSVAVSKGKERDGISTVPQENSVFLLNYFTGLSTRYFWIDCKTLSTFNPCTMQASSSDSWMEDGQPTQCIPDCIDEKHNRSVVGRLANRPDILNCLLAFQNVDFLRLVVDRRRSKLGGFQNLIHLLLFDWTVRE